MSRRSPSFVGLAFAFAFASASLLAGGGVVAAAPAAAGPTGNGEVIVEEAVSGLGPVTDFAFLPDGTLIVLEKDGVIRARRPDGKLALAARFPVDDESEKGMLGVAVDPDFARTRRLFLYYSLADDAGGTDLDRHRVVSVVVGADLRIDPAPARQKVLIRGLRGPANHDGGALAFGRDGKLYVGTGDTGCNSNRRPEPPYEPTNTFGTCLTNGNGKILRINPDGTIPADNPLVGKPAVTACADTCRGRVAATTRGAPRADIWAWGLRNAWRIWPDPKTGLVWVGDVGEITYEEIAVVDKGRHQGWPWREGPAGWPAARCDETTPGSGACVEPAYSCIHDGAGRPGIDGDCKSITGGLIVDACPWPAALRDHYLFGDNVTARLWTLKVNPSRTGIVRGTRREIARFTNGVPVSIHLGPDGLVYVASFPGDAGRILRLRPARPDPCPSVPGPSR
jgi:glucose/arabinose dehydrogenase